MDRIPLLPGREHLKPRPRDGNGDGLDVRAAAMLRPRSPAAKFAGYPTEFRDVRKKRKQSTREKQRTGFDFSFF